MLKPTMPKQPVRKDQEQEEDRGEKAPVLLLAARTGLIRLVGRLGRAAAGTRWRGPGWSRQPWWRFRCCPGWPPTRTGLSPARWRQSDG